jgi:hypothetical protein
MLVRMRALGVEKLLFTASGNIVQALWKSGGKFPYNQAITLLFIYPK